MKTRQNLVRNIFDQYQHDENRLTHALIQALTHNPRLTREFTQFATGSAPPKGAHLSFSCQALPGEERDRSIDEEEAEGRGLPDAWIYDDRGSWAVVLECKLTASLNADQLARHVLRARSLGFESIHLLIITADRTQPRVVANLSRGIHARWRNWPWVFQFFSDHAKGYLESEFVNYLRVLESQMVAKGYEVPPLTRFTGIPFGPSHPYTEPEAKVILRALMVELSACLRLSKVLPEIDQKVRQKRMTGAWDIVRFAFASKDRNHTKHPHIAVGLATSSDWSRFGQLWLQLVLPNNARPEYWARIRNAGKDELSRVLLAVAKQFSPLLRRVEMDIWEPKLTFRTYQRHFYAQKRSTTDGQFAFDLGTVFGRRQGGVKAVPGWVEALHVILAQTCRANFELALQAGYPLWDGSICRGGGLVKMLRRSAEAFQPFLALLRA